MQATNMLRIVLLAVVAACLTIPVKALDNIWTVYVGAETADGETDLSGQPSWAIHKFYPQSLTIMYGDSVIFRQLSNAPHTITYTGNSTSYNNATLMSALGVGSNRSVTALSQSWSSGMLSSQSGVPDFTVLFPYSGAYMIYSANVPGMTFNLSVGYPTTPITIQPYAVQAAAEAQIAADLASLSTAANSTGVPQLYGNPASTIVSMNGNSSTTWQVYAGYGITTSGFTASHNRFTPWLTTVTAGDTVVFSAANAVVPHYVAFNGNGIDFSQVNGFTATPTVTNFNGQGVAASGQLSNLPGGQLNYSLVFTQSGMYRYIDPMFVQSGMFGLIQVNAAPSPAASTAGINSTANVYDGNSTSNANQPDQNSGSVP